MRIALYGSKEKVHLYEQKLRTCFQWTENAIQIDVYSDDKLLMKQATEYDAVCMSESFIDMITKQPANPVVFEWGKNVRTCNSNDIYYVEADLKYIHIRFADSEIRMRLPFSKVEKLLERADFIKIHRSYLVNCMYIQSMDEQTVTLRDGRFLPVSKYREEAVHKQYMEYMQKNETKWKENNE